MGASRNTESHLPRASGVQVTVAVVRIKLIVVVMVVVIVVFVVVKIQFVVVSGDDGGVVEV